MRSRSRTSWKHTTWPPLSRLEKFLVIIVGAANVQVSGEQKGSRLGKGVVVFVLLFVLCFLPSLLSDIAELSDGDDTSAEEQQINAVASLHEAVLDLHEDVEHLAATARKSGNLHSGVRLLERFLLGHEAPAATSGGGGKGLGPRADRRGVAARAAPPTRLGAAAS